MELTTIAEGVHFAHTPLVGWVVLVEGDSVCLVDCGYPGQLADVEESVRRAGARPEQIDAVLVTHAHVDHIGTLPRLVEKYGVRVLTGEVEARHVRGEVHESAGPLDVLVRAYRPRVLTWGLRIAALGGSSHPHVDVVEPVPFDTPLDLPRSPQAVDLAGHTSGHVAYVVPDAGAIALGDALATGHPLSGRSGPQILPGFFHQDEERLRETLTGLAGLDVDRLLPGHGPATQLPITAAVETALNLRQPPDQAGAHHPNG